MLSDSDFSVIRLVGLPVRQINGQCHCGNLRFRFFLPIRAGPIPVRACGCTFCLKHGGVYTSHPQGRLEARVEDRDLLNRYRFGTSTADFYICTRCGVVPFVVSNIDGSDYAVVNVNAFEDVPPGDLDASPTDFDGEALEARLGRRSDNWIADVEIDDSA